MREKEKEVTRGREGGRERDRDVKRGRERDKRHRERKGECKR